MKSGAQSKGLNACLDIINIALLEAQISGCDPREWAVALGTMAYATVVGYDQYIKRRNLSKEERRFAVLELIADLEEAPWFQKMLDEQQTFARTPGDA